MRSHLMSRRLLISLLAKEEKGTTLLEVAGVPPATLSRGCASAVGPAAPRLALHLQNQHP